MRTSRQGTPGTKFSVQAPIKYRGSGIFLNADIRTWEAFSASNMKSISGICCCLALGIASNLYTFAVAAQDAHSQPEKSQRASVEVMKMQMEPAASTSALDTLVAAAALNCPVITKR